MLDQNDSRQSPPQAMPDAMSADAPPPTITGPLALGTCQVVRPTTREILGYAHTVPNEGGQLQRWLLFRDPENDFEIVPAESPMASWSLETWKANVPSLWQPGSYYVWAQADIYVYGKTYAGKVWTEIPTSLPPATFPTGMMGAPFQLDPIGGKIIRVVEDNVEGTAYTCGGLTDSTSVEYWFLPGSFVPAGQSAKAKVTMGPELVPTLDDFVRTANARWSAGSVLAVTGCMNHTGNAPATP